MNIISVQLCSNVVKIIMLHYCELQPNWTEKHVFSLSNLSTFQALLKKVTL